MTTKITTPRGTVIAGRRHVRRWLF